MVKEEVVSMDDPRAQPVQCLPDRLDDRANDGGGRLFALGGGRGRCMAATTDARITAEA